jgi:hypothetical protein
VAKERAFQYAAVDNQLHPRFYCVIKSSERGRVPTDRVDQFIRSGPSSACLLQRRSYSQEVAGSSAGSLTVNVVPLCSLLRLDAPLDSLSSRGAI